MEEKKPLKWFQYYTGSPRRKIQDLLIGFFGCGIACGVIFGLSDGLSDTIVGKIVLVLISIAMSGALIYFLIRRPLILFGAALLGLAIPLVLFGTCFFLS